jgi:hypothetical protein
VHPWKHRVFFKMSEVIAQPSAKNSFLFLKPKYFIRIDTRAFPRPDHPDIPAV